MPLLLVCSGTDLCKEGMVFERLLKCHAPAIIVPVNGLLDRYSAPSRESRRSELQCRVWFDEGLLHDASDVYLFRSVRVMQEWLVEISCRIKIAAGRNRRYSSILLSFIWLEPVGELLCEFRGGRVQAPSGPWEQRRSFDAESKLRCFLHSATGQAGASLFSTSG